MNDPKVFTKRIRRMAREKSRYTGIPNASQTFIFLGNMAEYFTIKGIPIPKKDHQKPKKTLYECIHHRHTPKSLALSFLSPIKR